MDRIYMSSPDVGEAERDHLLEALDSGWIAPLGPQVDAFEAEMAQRIGVSHAVALSSGTAALHLGLLSLGVGPGDVVVTATMTFAATANAVVYSGAQPYFVDCDLESGNIDPRLLEEALARLTAEGARVAAIVPVDLLGKSADYHAIQEVADRYGVPVLSDAAESLGASYEGRAAGSFGRASALSFNGNKIITTSGGGMLLTDDAELERHVRYLATQARQPVVHYEHTDIGYNYRMSNLLASLGRAQLSRLDSMMARRRALRLRYVELFAGTPGITIFQGEGQLDNCWLTSVIIDDEATGWKPSELLAALAEHNIESRPLWKPMHLQPVFADAPALVNGNAQYLFEHGLTLPSGSNLTEEQIERVFDAIRQFLGGRNG